MSNTLEDNQQYRRFLDERQSLNDARFKVAETLDKALLTLSGGALGISMTFVKDIAKNPMCKMHPYRILDTLWVNYCVHIVVALLLPSSI